MTQKTELPIEERKRGTRCCEGLLKFRLHPEGVQQLSADLQALAHPVRLQILDILARNEGKICVCDLESTLPIKQPTISHHLKLLREAGLIDCDRQGLWAYYFIKRDALRELGARVTQGIKAFA